MTYRLENWSVVTAPDPYVAPEMRTNRLNGDVYNHPSFPEGHCITTSKIESCKDGAIITRSGSVYALGVVDHIYEAYFPDAKERLLKSLSAVTPGE